MIGIVAAGLPLVLGVILLLVVRFFPFDPPLRVREKKVMEGLAGQLLEASALTGVMSAIAFGLIAIANGLIWLWNSVI
jgi:hypothetical protein